MNCLRSLCGVTGAAIAFAAFAPSALAQEDIIKYACQSVGNSAPEPLGDREGHSISVEQFSCRVESGPMSGGVMSGALIWEWDKTNAVLISGSGVVRKPGATVVYKDVEGKLALTMADGKVTGFTASGGVNFPIATGSGASLAGKSAAWTATPTGPDQFELVDKVK
jgi:hypothetical protein